MDNEKSELCKYRIERCLEEISISKLLLEEGHFKKSINSSYYAVFHGIRAVFALESIDFRKHDKCIAEFNRRYVNAGIFDKYFARNIDKLFRLRNKSDYDDFFLISKEDATNQYEMSQVICNSLCEYIYSRLED